MQGPAVLLVLVVGVAHGSLMNRIGLRLGSKHIRERGPGHKPRVPWAVKHMREEQKEIEDNAWRNRHRGDPDPDDDGRPPPCVGICYYNKLMALEAKEELTRHNEVYKQEDELCTGSCNDMDEDITNDEENQNEVNNSQMKKDGVSQ